jgi:hypothetical protein
LKSKYNVVVRRRNGRFVKFAKNGRNLSRYAAKKLRDDVEEQYPGMTIEVERGGSK